MKESWKGGCRNKIDGTRNYEIVRLFDKQKEVLRLLATGLYTVKEVATIVGYTPSTVSGIINSALGRQTLEILRGAADADTVDLMIQIRAAAPLAFAVQQEMLFEPNTDDRLKNAISNKILDRAGYTPITKNLNMNVNRGITREDLEEIKSRAADLAEVVEEKETEMCDV